MRFGRDGSHSRPDRIDAHPGAHGIDDTPCFIDAAIAAPSPDQHLAIGGRNHWLHRDFYREHPPAPLIDDRDAETVSFGHAPYVFLDDHQLACDTNDLRDGVEPFGRLLRSARVGKTSPRVGTGIERGDRLT